ncbi:type II toxin-antitoxin system HicA family toxin [Methanotrichaceae archaeon M04Ac]|uniref:Type II toxin-antitoxin system HicA family toxin n=1 Tax=Candidatus Methanocrinis alkalitolerans TaxID=3033395 RepID=A0ABT5XCI6_9EURY|nr:type II toxin-antitoxin system HicA family toxin [Candidatus Methanocrinis alkalitolerans]MCR3883136.1 type II toxin-antitoxin system HicA family toxin [Methanothrix sp.]MDF0592402.1 type II toxin-antitoxin system HicA family toxin [Candidatus Methanocrinis alkalitolerans]
MSRLSPVSWNELIRRLHALGFEGPYSGRGPHPIMLKGSTRLMVPNPHRGDISVDLLKKILRQGEISREDWLSV